VGTQFQIPGLCLGVVAAVGGTGVGEVNEGLMPEAPTLGTRSTAGPRGARHPFGPASHVQDLRMGHEGECEPLALATTSFGL
jgi:hypothetical protein